MRTHTESFFCERTAKIRQKVRMTVMRVLCTQMGAQHSNILYIQQNFTLSGLRPKK